MVAVNIGSKDKSAVYYDPPIKEVVQPVRHLLETYARIPPEEVIPRLNEMRDRMWDVFPWPCVGQFRFMDLSLAKRATYPQLVARLSRPGARLLDMGCGIAQDLRQLAADGVPTTNLYGLEAQEGFLALGYDLFGDAATFPADHFIAADLLDRSPSGNLHVAALSGTLEAVHLGMILHLWDLEGQIDVCRRAVEMLRPEPGVLVLGQCVGNLEGVQMVGRGGRRMFRHCDASFARMWEDIGRRTDTRWRCDARLEAETPVGDTTLVWDEAERRRLVFEVERLE